MKKNLFQLAWASICHLRIEKEKKYTHFGNVLTKLASIYQLRTRQEKIKALKTFCWTQKKYFHDKVSLKNMEDKMLGSSLNLCSLNELGQVTTMEATKMDQKPSITDCVLKHGGTAKTVKRYQPDQNACVTMKSRS